jgi:hypothetical protein
MTALSHACNKFRLSIACMKKVLIYLIVLLFFYNGYAQTNIGKTSGAYHELFNGLKKELLTSDMLRTVNFGGKPRNVFVPWIRDNVHVMKAMKYFVPEISSFWQFFMETQTPEGLYFDYYYPISDGVSHRMNLFDKRYWRVFPRDSIQMHRLPVEADLEYLMVEGAYHIWQATGDNEYIRTWLDDLEEGMRYAMSDPLRWSKKHQLVKRGYTLDTWDFMQLPTSRQEYTRQGKDVQKGIFDIDENTPMGIMHGDNSGMYAACLQLSEMYASLGEQTKSKVWKHQAEIFRERTNALCWNGKFYAHFVPDDPVPSYLHMDQKNSLSLSNPYDINRGLPTREMAISIINTYRELKGKNEMNSFAEWFGIYPAVKPHFADYLPGSYMNGGVNTIVAGELAKAAFENGMEEYGADILNRILGLIKKHNGKLPVAYNPDGKVDEGIPDNWGQAAVMSALIEGLAGVKDSGQLFRSVIISPRWLSADQNQADVNVTYGPSSKSVKYDYRYESAASRITMSISGSPDNYQFRILLPKGKKSARATVDNRQVRSAIEQVNNSNYVTFAVGKGDHNIIVSF